MDKYLSYLAWKFNREAESYEAHKLREASFFLIQEYFHRKVIRYIISNLSLQMLWNIQPYLAKVKAKRLEFIEFDNYFKDDDEDDDIPKTEKAS